MVWRLIGSSFSLFDSSSDCTVIYFIFIFFEAKIKIDQTFLANFISDEIYTCKCKIPKPKCNKTKSNCILTAAFNKYKQVNIKNPDSNINLNHAVFCHDCYKIIYDENRFFHMRLYLHGLSCYLDRINKQYDVNVEKQSFLLKKHMELINFADFEILKYAKVIGMTTSCAGRYNRLLKDLGPKVLVVEEAAHVLEAHIIAALTPAIDHLVLIGD